MNEPGIDMELEDEKFTVNTRLSRIMSKGQLVSAHILPNGQNRWLVGGPRLVNWPFSPGPHSVLG